MTPASAELELAPWTPSERDAWRPAPLLPVPEWAERERVLGPDETSVPGRWDNAIAPFLVEPMRAMGDTVHRIVSLLKGAQVGGSEAARNWLAQRAATDPAPALILFPTKDSAKDVLDERIIPMLKNTPALARLLTGKVYDTKARQIRLRTHRIHVAWAGAPQTVASRPIRDLLCDETDKYPITASSQEGSDARTLAKLRLTTFKHRAKTVEISTPTNRHGIIYQSWLAAADRRVWEIPCLECGGYQTISWDRLEFRGKGSTSLEEWRAIAGEAPLPGDPRAVRYRCVSCGHLHAERDKARMNRRGRWRSEGCEPGVHPQSAHVAFHIPSTISPWVTWADIVAEHFDARLRGIVALAGWTNGRMGAVSDELEAGRFERERILALAARGHPRGVVPRWATILITTADTQRNGWWWVTRAHGPEGRSRLLAYDFAKDEATLRREALDARYTIDGVHVPAVPSVMFVNPGTSDGDREDDADALATDRATRLAATDPDRIKLIRGYGGSYRAPSRWWQTTGKGLPEAVELFMVCTQTYKDLLAGRIVQDEPAVWEVTSAADARYAGQLASEEKIQQTVGARTLRVWVMRSAEAQNHLWDCEVYQTAAADILAVDTYPRLADRVAVERGTDPVEPRHDAGGEGGWWSGVRPGGWA